MNPSPSSPVPLKPELNPRPLPSPSELRERFPLSEAAARTVQETRNRLATRLSQGEGPLIAVVGPCSLHSEEAALAYADRLAPLARRLADDVIIVMRAYFEKPRTTVGWKGFLYDPDMNGSHDLEQGLCRGRSLLTELAERGLSLATELLDPLATPYLEDCLSWAAIGARTAESQIHRQLVSGMTCPVGFKNGTDGSVSIALAAMESSRAAHSHLGIDAKGRVALVRTPGNPNTHVVLRGGKSGPNYHSHHITRIAEGAPGRLPLLVDCSHGNSEKDFRRQSAVADAVLEQVGRRDVDLLGLMVESHLDEGRQEPGPKATPRQSVTDACLGFEETASLLEKMARATRPKKAFTGAYESRSLHAS